MHDWENPYRQRESNWQTLPSATTKSETDSQAADKAAYLTISHTNLASLLEDGCAEFVSRLEKPSGGVP